MIFIIIPVFNRWHFTELCLKSLIKQIFVNYKIIVVDHGSKDGTPEKIAINFPEVIVILGNERMWWAAATNIGIKYAVENNADYVLTLNNDLVVQDDYLTNLISVMHFNKNSVVGSVSVDFSNRNKIIFAGTRWNSFTAKYSSLIDLSIPYNQLKQTVNIIESDLLPGRGTLFPIEVFKEIGFFDHINFPHYAADEDLSVQCKKNGYVLLISVNAFVTINTNDNFFNTLKQISCLNKLRIIFTSTKSPLRTKTRWSWAKKNGKIPIIYFAIDLIRISISILMKL